MAVVRMSKVETNDQGAYAFLFQPDDDQQHPGIVLIQEWWGIEAHIIDLGQKLASEGFLVAVPDLYHGRVATEPDDATKMVMLVRQNLDRALGEIAATLDMVKQQPAITPKKPGIIGFCLGGLLTFLTAERYPDLGCAVPFYAGHYDPTPEEVARVRCPILAIYGKQDKGIPQSQIQKIEKLYHDAGKDLTVKVYDAGHAFLNPSHDAYNAQAAADAWPRAVQFLKQHLR
ncbi:carboxymethylenebutenolidase [Thermosporothrix hazakensis]|jgi:carboxymethylenebutenolidase|uniref:Carboxymethylenebutenolidase n=1 Tax=Thermosporothrix hazakensis TaxID=644383 RepID=A0A326UC29_THEHA|nr:dienelactone hydrolase family protein [Thermosporothrix hazakensis]PZW32925.1 carboxymethylenebutenolidase [Thermosporothrix hazakensis]GCE48957.1 hypothetical protein KTH_38260 [Thermosporothrix hazakensis]